MPTHSHGYGPARKVTRGPVDLLVCFAVVEEMKFFAPSRPRQKGLPAPLPLQVCLTGIGRRNAAMSIREAIAAVHPKRVITAGFAGGLNPALKPCTVIYEDDEADFGPELEDLGAIKGKFYCHRRVAITAAEKAELWKSSAADAVEMESSVIRTICREFGIPSVTVRVISDDAHQDLPLDFNALMSSDDRIHLLKLVRAVVRQPSRIPKLIQFQRQTVEAARRLGAVLEELVRVERC